MRFMTPASFLRMQRFVGDDGAMIDAPIQRDIAGIPKGSHDKEVAPIAHCSHSQITLMDEREAKARREPFLVAALFLGGDALILIAGKYPSRYHGWISRTTAPGEFYRMVLILACVGVLSLWWGYARRSAQSDRPPE
jgi:hypothetical protein